MEILTEAILWFGRYPVPKRRESWDKAVQLRQEHLYTEAAPGFPVLIPNEQLNWPSFNELWLKADQLYWQLLGDA